MLAFLFLGLAQATPPPPVLAGTPSRGGVLAYIVDGEGALLVADWHVNVTRVTRLPGRTDQPIYGVPRQGTIDPTTGCAVFDGLPPGDYELRALHSAGDDTSADVQVLPRETVVCELLVVRGDPRRALYVEVHGARPSAPPRILARNVAGDAVELVRESPYGPFVARGVAPDRYTVEVDDPRYRSSVVHDVVPGTLGQLSLTGSAGLALRFRCAEDGAALQPIALTAGEASAVLVDGATEHELHGLVPGDHLAIAQFSQHATLALQIDALAPSEVRALEVEVPRGASVRGAVVDASGAPCEGVFVEGRAYPERAEASELHRHTLGSGASVTVQGNLVSRRIDLTGLDHVDRRSAWTDADGRFELSGFVPGEIDLTVWPTPSSSSYVRVLVGEGEALASVPELRLKGAAHADVSVLLPQGFTLGDFALSLQFADGSPTKLAHRPAGIDARERILLRGLAPRPTKLIATRRAPLYAWRTEVSSTWEVEFTPTAGSPAQVVLDLTREGE